MTKVTDLYPGSEYETRVWITDKARADLDLVPTDLGAIFEGRAEKGFKDYMGPALRAEGGGIWAFGTNTWTVRIAGFFPDPNTRKEFVVCGVWKGKPGSKKRPPRAEHIVEEAKRIRDGGIERCLKSH